MHNKDATKIIGIEVAAAGVGIQLLCLLNSLNPFDHSHDVLINAGFCLGTLLTVVGCVIYVKGIGRHPAFGLFGILSIPGFYILSLLKEKEKAQ